jgi:hypothetical protein
MHEVFITSPVNMLMRKDPPDDDLLEVETRIILSINFEMFFRVFSVSN